MVYIPNVGDIGVVHGDIFVDDGGVVVVVDDRLIHGGVRDVDIVHVGAAHAIGRHIDFTRTEREPTDVYTSGGTANPDADGKMWTANPSDQSGRVDGADVSNGHGARRARNPTPTTAVVDPAAVVERRKAPRSIINPGPAPRRNPCPVAVAIGCPCHNGGMREPHGAVFGNLAPATVIVEIFVADDVIGNVAAGRGVIFTVIATITPAVKVIFVGEWFNVGIRPSVPEKNPWSPGRSV